MRFNSPKVCLNLAATLAAGLLLGASVSSAQPTVNLTAQATTAALPDGQMVPMWGYVCTDAGSSGATCAAANSYATPGSWSPVVITAPTGSTLTINLTNNLSFPITGGGANSVPTSLVIVGQIGGGLGATPSTVPSPSHANQTSTWPIAGGGSFTPPSQPNRVQSFATEVQTGTPATLTWANLKAGTYLIESGTHPSIQGPMGLYGVLVVTSPATAGTPGSGTAYPAVGATPAVTYSADVPLVLSEIDPVQNSAVAKAVTSTGFSEGTVWSAQPGGCGNPATPNSGNCYPPAVNYTPLYYMINGVSLDRTNLAKSVFSVTPAGSPSQPVSGNVLVRLVNAGLRMHVPSLVGTTTGTASPAAGGFSLIAEDGNLLPGVPRVQSEVFMAAGKTYDVMINAPAAGASAIPVFDRQLSLSTNNRRDGGMQAYVSLNGALAPTVPSTAAQANPDSYPVVPGNTLTVGDPSKGLIANDIGVYGVQSSTLPTHGALSLNSDGTFTYAPDASWSASTPTVSDSFVYIANGNSMISATVTLGACTGTCLGGKPTTTAGNYFSNIASRFAVGAPGVFALATDPQGHPFINATLTDSAGGTVKLNKDGSFTAVPTTPPTGVATATVSFHYTVTNSQNTTSDPNPSALVTVTFMGGTGLKVNVLDAPVGQVGTSGAPITDYRWIIEEDRTFQIDPSQENSGGPVPSLGTNFHTSYMPVVAAGCVGVWACEYGQTMVDPSSGAHVPAICDIGDGLCRTDPSGQQVPVDPSQVHLDPRRHYYISILPGDAGNSFTFGGGAPVPINPADPNSATRQFSIPTDCGPYTGSAGNWTVGAGQCGHGMGGAPISPAQISSGSVNVLLQETPFQTAKISVFVYEDDFPLNGENDASGGVDVLAPNEPGLGGFEIRLWDDAGGTGDATGQMTYDMFNMPLSNSLAGTKDPAHPGNDACPITSASDGIVGRIVTCPKYESDGVTLSPLAGQAVIANMMPGRYGVQADPGGDRIARGEEWLQTNTLDGQKAHDSFIKVGGPAYFQEFGPAGFHVSIGFANPAIINARHAGVCGGTDVNVTGTNCTNEVMGTVTEMRQSHPPDQRLYSSTTNQALSFTQCYVSLGDPDGEDFIFGKCDANGHFDLKGVPQGDWRLTVFDQWNDQIVDGLSTPVGFAGGGGKLDFDANGGLAVQQWHTNVSTSEFDDINGNGVRDPGEPGLALTPINIRFRDGSYSNFNNTDLNGFAQYNEIFPLFNWYVIETDTTQLKQTGVHVVYDGGGLADGTPGASNNSNIAQFLASTVESHPVPSSLRFPGSVYCGNADCTDITGGITAGLGASSSTPSTGRIDPPWVTTEGFQSFIGQYQFLEFGKAPYNTGENGGIHGEVIYASTRPFDDPALLIHTSWTPDVPNVTVNLYKESTAADGTTSLTLVDTTKTSSWDDWAQGFRSDGVPNMNCPGQADASGDLYYFTLQDTPYYLDQYNATYNGGTQHTLPLDSRYKCYDGLHNYNQVQPAPYDGMYQFPSVTSRDPVTGKPTGTNCTGCVPDPSSNIKGTPTYDPYNSGIPMLPAGKYVVEMITPPGYELVKEEDKNILIGDNYIAPVIQEFGGLGNIFILPDQASVLYAYNVNNGQNPTNNLGRTTYPTSEGDTGSVETFWPCVGQARIVPDYISLFPGSKEVAPFAGATRNLCDRKEVTLTDQTAALAKFWIFSSTHVAAHFTGFILDDLSSEFDPFSPQFGEKFAVPNLPVSIKDFAGNEVERVYSDQWGTYNGLNYSTWEVNPPNPTGYAPTMMVACMNDPGNGPTPDPYFNPSYSQFCYEIPYMPGQTQYMDTPVVPTAAFAEGYNPADCAYPDATPAIKSVIGNDAPSVTGSGKGPWVSAAGTGHTLTITALGPTQVPNPAYTGPQATAAPFNKKFLTRNYGFGGTQGTVTIGGVNAPVVTGMWSDTSITVTVPAGVPSCDANGAPLQINGTPGTTFAAQCGQLVITAANGQKSIDAITVTIGGKAPSYVNGENQTNNAIQTAIDSATPGDLILVGPGVYNEMVLMWKPVRLQGVGAGSVTINANTHPSGKLDPWRRQVNCLFGLATNGSLLNAGNVYDPTGQYTCPANMQAAVDPLPLEGIVGWDTTLNGNLAELLQEPSLMGAYEGAGITVLGKGENMSIDSTGTGAAGTEGDFPAGSRVLTNSNADCRAFPSNFLCNPSRIDGLTITNSSQGGGGIFVHAWNHFLEISNNRIFGNAGTLSGGINVGQGESPDANLDAAGNQLAFLFDGHVNVHNNAVTANTSYGDELFSASPSAAGGVTFCTGADYYHFNYNWVCGNLSTGDGGGLVHEGFIFNGDISHNWILFNQSNNISIPTNGGGIAVLGAAPDGTPPGAAAGTECGSTTDVDCAPGLSDGTGPGLVIDSNVIMGNTAESGSGGGIRIQTVNGTEVVRHPGLPGGIPLIVRGWNDVTVTNNIIANNVAGWDGAGISLQDALKVNIINNSIVSNDTTASSGVLFSTLGAPQASTPPPTGGTTTNATNSAPQPAGLVTMANTGNLTSGLTGLTVVCPLGHPNCKSVSYPLLANNLFWQNRFFHIQVGGLGSGTLSQQNLVTLLPALNQTTTGQCVTDTGSYWDIGVRGDTGPGDHSSGITLAPSYSILTTGYTGSGNSNANPNVVSQYCNGARVPPENGGFGYSVPPGISDATVPNPIFNLTAAATVDEGNNWINMAYGPLSLQNVNPSSAPTPLGSTGANGTANGNYGLTAASTAAIGVITLLGAPVNYAEAPSVDILGTNRKANLKVDIGAVEFVGGAPPTLTAITPNTGTRNSSVSVTLTGTNLTGTTAINVSGLFVTVSALTVVNDSTVTATFTIGALAGQNARTVSVTTPNGTSNTVTFTVVAPTLTSIAPSTGNRGAVVPVTLTGTNLAGATGVNVSGTGVTVSGVTVVNPTTVTATFTIAAGATASGRTVTVTTPGGTTNGVTFTVATPPAPTLTSISPVTGNRGAVVPVTLTGTNLTAASAITVSGGNVTVSGITVVNSTTVTATFTIAAGAAASPRTVSVTTPGGTSGTVTFTVTTPPAPTLTSISPVAGTHSATGSVTVPVTLTGTNLTGTSAITISGTGVTANSITVVNATTVTANFVITSAAATTSRTVTVTTPGGTSNSTAFKVN